MKKIRRSFGSANRLEQNLEEAPPLDLTKDVADNMKELLSEITKKEAMSTTKRMGYLSNFVQFVRSVPLTADFGITLDDIVACLRVPLVSSAKEVRAAGLRALRHFLEDDDTVDVLLNQRIQIFISKSLDLPPQQEVERVQALRLVRKMVHVCPRKFPLSVAMVLAAISLDNAHDKDRLSRACLATLCELAVQNVEVASYSGVVGAIVTNTLDCATPRMNESLICTILHLYNHPSTRQFIRRGVGLEPLLAPFTDLYYTHSSDLSDSQIKEDRAIRVESAKLALVAVVRSWAGLVCFCDPDNNSIASLLGVFDLPNVHIRNAIIDTLFDIFLLRQPEMTDDFAVALQSVDPSAMQEDWKLTDQFLVAEADAVLPHRATCTRANIIENYLSLLLSAFVDAGILASLVKVITTSDDVVCIRGSILLGEILHMINQLLPPGHSVQTHCLPLLISLATNIDKPAMERGKANAVIGYLDQIHKMKKRGAVPNTLIMEQLINQVEAYESQPYKSQSRQEKADLQFAWKEMDEVLSAIRETGMFTVGAQDFDFETWNWDLISTVLESGKMSIKKQEEPIFYRFIKRLATFYKPFEHLYSTVPLTDPMARKYSEVALQLVDFLLLKDEQPEGERLLVEILQDIRDCLGEAIQPGRLNGTFSTSNLSETLTRDYFLLIGRLSSTTEGIRILEKTPGIFQYLMEICSMGSRESLIKLIISCLDYGREGITRVLLSKTLSAAPLMARLYATKLLRVLLRVKCPYFCIWGIEFLTNQLYDQEMEVVETAIEILEEACEDEANLQRLMEVKPMLLHLGEKGIRLLSRYVSIINGFNYLKEMDYLNTLVQAWKDHYNREYVSWMELEITDALSTYERQGAQGSYVRRSNNRFIKRKDVYVLPHMYGELAKHRNGIELLQDENLISDTIDTIVCQRIDTFEDICQLKAALWAMGHMISSRSGITEVLSYNLPSYTSSEACDSSSACETASYASEDEGLQCLDEITEMKMVNEDLTPMDEKPSDKGFEPPDLKIVENDNQNGSFHHDDGENEEEEEEKSVPTIIDVIVNMASKCEVLSVRGTCFYVLGLIGSTSTGADKLEILGWDSVRHRCSEEWPVIEPDGLQYFFDEPDISDDEQVAEGAEDSDNVTSQAETTLDRFGGIYLGEDNPSEINASDQALVGFAYNVYFYGDKKKKGKQLTSDESRYLQHMASMASEPETNIKTKFFDIDSWGNKYEKGEDLLAGLDRLNHNLHRSMTTMSAVDSGGIYLGDDTPATNDTSFSDDQRFESFEDFAPFLSGKHRNQFHVPPPYESPSVSVAGKTKALLDDAGIYLGEIPDENDDTIEANLSPLTSTAQSPTSPASLPASAVSSVSASTYQSADYPRTYSIEGSEPLKPIREEKSQESLDSKGVNIAIEESQENGHDSSYRTNDPLLRTSISEDRNSTQSPINANDISIDESRYRSVSFTDEGVRVIADSRSPRSSSFSGSGQNRFLVRGTIHPRSGSDPGLGVIPSSLTASISSQESDNSRTEQNGKKTSSKKSGHRKKSRSETSDIPEHGRTSSILSDSGVTPGLRLRIAKRMRGGSTVSLGVSPKSSRSLGTPTSESLHSRDGIFGYTAWQTLKKQRPFKTEFDYSLRRNLASVDRRRFGRGFATQYRRIFETKGQHRRSSVPAFTRKQLASLGTSDQGYIAPPEDYIGRVLPRYLNDFFSVEMYTYVGSWADHFMEFTESNNIQTFDKEFKHDKEHCLHCNTKYGPFVNGKPRSESDISVQSKSRSSSREDATCDEEDSESSGGRDEMSNKMKMNVKKDVLRLVVNLSSAVASKSTQQEIIALHGRHPWAFQDLCLYSQVAELLGMFSFRIAIRRFIQKLFEAVDYHVIFEMADTILGRTYNNHIEKK